MQIKNLFDLPPYIMPNELNSTLLENANVRIERIVSTGQISEWYEQDENEFVCLLQGEAELTWEGGSTTKLLCGDFVTIPSHKRHRVSYTSRDPACIWLCVFWK